MASKKYSFSDPKHKKAWNFVWLNVLSIGAMLGLFYLILYADFLTGTFAAAWRWLAEHEVVLALAASTPFFAALLVGRASSKKAKRKRLREAQLRAQQEIEEARRQRAARRSSLSPRPPTGVNPEAQG